MIKFTEELKREIVKECFLDDDSVFKEGKPHNYIDFKPMYDELAQWLKENFDTIYLDEYGNQNPEMDMSKNYIGIQFTGNHDWKGWCTVELEVSLPLKSDGFTDIAYHDKHGDGDVIN